MTRLPSSHYDPTVPGALAFICLHVLLAATIIVCDWIVRVAEWVGKLHTDSQK